MTSANKHRERSHRSHKDSTAVLGTYSQRSYVSAASKQINKDKAKSVFTKIGDRLKNLASRLTGRFSQNFRKQDRG